MKVVWERDSVTVRDVYEALLEKRKVAYTTVMTMMKILEQKKYLKRTQLDRAYVYRPAQPQRQVVVPTMMKEPPKGALPPVGMPEVLLFR